jgi:hypothetical protein
VVVSQPVLEPVDLRLVEVEVDSVEVLEVEPEVVLVA